MIKADVEFQYTFYMLSLRLQKKTIKPVM